VAVVGIVVFPGAEVTAEVAARAADGDWNGDSA
jgi:hypothetical protein